MFVEDSCKLLCLRHVLTGEVRRTYTLLGKLYLVLILIKGYGPGCQQT